MTPLSPFIVSVAVEQFVQMVAQQGMSRHPAKQPRRGWTVWRVLHCTTVVYSIQYCNVDYILVHTIPTPLAPGLPLGNTLSLRCNRLAPFGGNVEPVKC